jgi:HEAT repeats
VNQRFRLSQGAYDLHAHTTVVVRKQNLFDSPKVEQMDVADSLRVNVQHGNGNDLESAFRPIVLELNNPELRRRAEAAAAIMQMAPPFLEDTLIELTKTNLAHSTITALRKADTPETRSALTEIAVGSDDATLRIEAIQNLGRTKDAAYLPTLFQLMESGSKEMQNAAAEAAGTLGGAPAVQRLSTFVFGTEAERKIAGASGLGRTRAREAVAVLIGLLMDSDSNVRQAAVSSLWLLTHHAAVEANGWADISTAESAASVHQRWVIWWRSHGGHVRNARHDGLLLSATAQLRFAAKCGNKWQDRSLRKQATTDGGDSSSASYGLRSCLLLPVAS